MFLSIIASFTIPALLALTFQGNSVKQYPVAADHSLTAAAYIQKGLPAHDRAWNGKDYEQAAVVLRDIAAQDVTQLPRYGSPTFGVVFARLVSLDNLSKSRNETVNLPARFNAALAILGSISQIIPIYSPATTKEGASVQNWSSCFALLLKLVTMSSNMRKLYMRIKS